MLPLFFITLKRVFNFKIGGSILTQLNLIFSPWGLKEKVLFALSKIVISRYIAKKYEVIFAKTNELAKIISRSYDIPQSKFRIIPLGADPELFKFNSEARASIRKKLGVSEDDVIIVYSGKIDPSKRLHILIEALSPIMKRDRRVKLLIIGRGDAEYIELLKKLISDENIAENVIFHPWVDRTMLNSLYSASDIGVWPGLSSISIVEAASSGLPLIIARYPVEIYAVENGNGFTFKIDDVNELRKCLEILIYDEKLRREMGYKSRKLVEEKLNWKTITLKYLEAYMDARKVS
jgi:glycosyltransferase involved in cell wall biosynthesis